MVIAPHSDDETLGCGGMIATSVQHGADVHVVLVTNGDGFRIAVGRAYKTLHVTPKKCIQFAYKRQKETLKALGEFGVKRSQVTFLGYPDRGVDKLWSKFWSPDTLFVSHATHSDHSPYRNSLTRKAPYCGESLLSDIEKTIRRFKPTDVYIPHPCDNHPDHYATSCFAAAAIEQLKSEGDAKGIRVHTYIVHRGDWPTPKGDHPEDPLAPPYGLARASTKWYSLPLTPDVAERKRRAICDYKTQVDVERSFMMSFARKNEIFGDVPVRRVASVKLDSISIDGRPDDWTRVPPAVVDTVGDYVMTGFSKGGDVRAVYLASDGKHLYARVDFVRHLSKRIRYNINFRGLGKGNSNDHYSVSIKLNAAARPDGTIWAARNNDLEIAIPLHDLNFDNDIFVQVQTKIMNLTVDNTGWQEVEFGGSGKQKVKSGK